MSVTIVYNFQAVPGAAGALLDLLQRGRDFALTVDGCEAFEVYQGKDDSHEFVMIERWTSVEAHQAHFEKNVKASGVLDRVEAFLTAPVQGIYYLRR